MFTKVVLISLDVLLIYFRCIINGFSMFKQTQTNLSKYDCKLSFDK